MCLLRFIRNPNLTYSCSIMIAKSSGSGLSNPSGMAPRRLKKKIKRNLAKKKWSFSCLKSSSSAKRIWVGSTLKKKPLFFFVYWSQKQENQYLSSFGSHPSFSFSSLKQMDLQTYYNNLKVSRFLLYSKLKVLHSIYSHQAYPEVLGPVLSQVLPVGRGHAPGVSSGVLGKR